MVNSSKIVMNVPDKLHFLESHEWVDDSNSEAFKVGISDHAQQELTDIVYLELPEAGRQVEKGEAMAVIESVKTANDIYAPISGEIVEVNEELVENIENVNSDPYGAGWMVAIKPSNPAELESLLDADAYRKLIS